MSNKKRIYVITSKFGGINIQHAPPRITFFSVLTLTCLVFKRYNLYITIICNQNNIQFSCVEKMIIIIFHANKCLEMRSYSYELPCKVWKYRHVPFFGQTKPFLC